MNDGEKIRDELLALDPLPPGAEGDWQNVLGRVARPRYRPRPMLAGGAIAVVVAVTAVLLLLPAGSGGPTSATAAVLDKLARLVATQSLTPGPGQYLYIESESDYPAFLNGGCETFTVAHEQMWIGADGSGLQRTTNGPQEFAPTTDRAACLQIMKLKSGGTADGWFAPHCLSLTPGLLKQGWSSLSTDPSTLLQQLRQLDGPRPSPVDPGEEFQLIGYFLRNTDAPATVRATLYRAAALIPGIQLLGTVHDHAGRPGLGIAYRTQGEFPGEASTAELIFDPKTGELSGEQGTRPSYWAVYLHDEVVNTFPTPPVPLGTACTPPGGGYTHHVPGGILSNGDHGTR